MPFYSSDESRKCCKLLLKKLEENKEEIQEVTVRLANPLEKASPYKLFYGLFARWIREINLMDLGNVLSA